MSNHRGCDCQCFKCTSRHGGCQSGCCKCKDGATGPAGATGNDGAQGATGETGQTGPSFVFASAIVRRVSDFPIPPGPATPIPFEVTEYPNSFWSFGDATKLTALIAGKYNVTAQAIFNPPVGATEYIIHIRKNGGPNVATSAVQITAAFTGLTATAIATTLVSLNALEYVEMAVEFNGVGSDLLSVSLASPVFSISRVDN